MVCPECKNIVKILPPHDFVVVDVKTSKKEQIRFGVYHPECYEKAKAKAQVESELMYTHYYKPLLPRSLREQEAEGE